MRRSGHPSRPRASTCCFLASFKTLLISTKATCLTPKSTSRASFSLAGFQVTLIGRFWVTPEVYDTFSPLQRNSLHSALVKYSLEKRSEQFSGIFAFLILALDFNEIS